MLSYQSIAELVEVAHRKNSSIGEIVLADQAASQEQDSEQLLEKMLDRLDVMRQSVKTGINDRTISNSGLSGDTAYLLGQHLAGGGFVDSILVRIMAKALVVAEVNARMGRIVAAPTAGSCGIIPGVILTIGEERGLSDRQLALSLFTAAGFGLVVANRAYISGAQGGCQAECGSAAGMAAAAAVELLGGSARQAGEALALALKNSLGLSCDPVAGLVEVPCIKRNAGQAAIALAAVEMALAGIVSAVKVDEVLDAMKNIGDQMPVSLKETALGGLAQTPSAKKVEDWLAKEAREHLE